MKKAALLVLCVALALPAFGAKKIIQPEGFPTTAPYSPGVLVDGTLYIAGQIGADLKTNKRPDDFQAEVRQALDRVGLILKAGGMGFEDVVSVNVYLLDIGTFAQMNEVYNTYFKTDKPVRVTVGAVVPGGGRVEVAAIARK
jgi:2-iminobutanoate/2-iminopropanoate deaminase